MRLQMSLSGEFFPSDGLGRLDKILWKKCTAVLLSRNMTAGRPCCRSLGMQSVLPPFWQGASANFLKGLLQIAGSNNHSPRSECEWARSEESADPSAKM